MAGSVERRVESSCLKLFRGMNRWREETELGPREVGDLERAVASEAPVGEEWGGCAAIVRELARAGSVFARAAGLRHRIGLGGRATRSSAPSAVRV